MPATPTEFISEVVELLSYARARPRGPWPVGRLLRIHDRWRAVLYRRDCPLLADDGTPLTMPSVTAWGETFLEGHGHGPVSAPADVGEEAGGGGASPPVGPGHDVWLTVARVCHGLTWFIGRGKNRQVYSKKVDRLVKSGALRDNGEEGRRRRISSASVLAYVGANGLTWNEEAGAAKGGDSERF
jgi:hypothetical protein